MTSKYAKTKIEKPATERLITRSVAITAAQQDLLNKHDLNLSAITRDAIDREIKRIKGEK